MGAWKDRVFGDIREIWTHFLLETSLHGCIRACKSTKNWIKRALWVSAIIASASVLVYSLFNMHARYYSYPFITKTRLERVRKQAMPAVSICDSAYRKTQLKNAEDLENQYIVKNSFVRFLGTFNVTQPSEDQKLYMNRNSTGRLLKDFIVSADFAGKAVNISEAFMIVYHRFGQCFTFNGRSKGGGTGMFLSNKETFNVILNISQESHVTLVENAGLEFLFHNAGELGVFSSSQVGVAPGFDTSISLTPTRFKYLPHPYNSLGSDTCVEATDPSKTLRWHKPYTHAACVEECAVIHALDKCKCLSTLYNFPDILSDQVCINTAAEQCVHLAYTEVYNTVIVHHTGVCNCPPACQTVSYGIRTSLSVFPKTSVVDFLVSRGVVASPEEIRDNFLRVSVQFDQMVINHVEHVPEISLGDIAGVLGGQMGLFLGASVLTLLEIAETIFSSLWILALTALGRRQKKVTSEKGTQEIPQIPIIGGQKR